VRQEEQQHLHCSKVKGTGGEFIAARAFFRSRLELVSQILQAL